MSELALPLVFYVFAALSVVGALGVITLRSPVHCALSLAVVFVSLAVMYVLLSAPFIAVAQIMIYAGAILVLFLFVIMVLNPRLEIGEGPLRGQQLAAAIAGLALVVVLGVALLGGQLSAAVGPYTAEVIARQGDTQIIGGLLFTNFLLPFEITSLVLIVAIVGVISLARGRGRG
ncbi:MAG: NADH-quinone oxidoreductase subunit J [Rudaea sp.]